MSSRTSINIGIRPIEARDAAPFYEAVIESRPHLSRWLSWCTPDYHIASAEDWACSAGKEWRAGSDHRFVIVDQDSGDILGSVGINDIDRQTMRGHLGYWVRQSALNKGVCTEAARQAVIFAFTELKLRRMDIHVHPENDSSNAVAVKLGALFEGVLKNKILYQGEMAPANCYSLVPSDYGLPS